MIFLKILLCILLFLAVLVIFVLFSRIRLTVNYRDKLKVYFKLSFLKILLYPDEEQIKTKGKKEKLKKVIKKKKNPPVEKGKIKQTEKEETGTLETVSPAAKVLYVVFKHFPRFLKIRISKLKITVGGKDAAAAAVSYGRTCAAADGILALAEEFFNISYNNKKVNIDLDYTADDIKTEYKISASIFVYQALYVLLKVGME